MAENLDPPREIPPGESLPEQQRFYDHQAILLRAAGDLVSAMDALVGKERVSVELGDIRSAQLTRLDRIRLLLSTGRFAEAELLVPESWTWLAQASAPRGAPTDNLSWYWNDLEWYQKTGQEIRAAGQIHGQAETLVAHGRRESALDLLRVEEDIRRRFREQRGLLDCLKAQARLAIELRDLDQARDILFEHVQLGRSFDRLRMLVPTLRWLSAILLEQGEYSSALRSLWDLRQLVRELHDSNAQLAYLRLSAYRYLLLSRTARAAISLTRWGVAAGEQQGGMDEYWANSTQADWLVQGAGRSRPDAAVMMKYAGLARARTCFHSRPGCDAWGGFKQRSSTQRAPIEAHGPASEGHVREGGPAYLETDGLASTLWPATGGDSASSRYQIGGIEFSRSSPPDGAPDRVEHAADPGGLAGTLDAPKITDAVDFAVTCPRVAAAGEIYLLDIWSFPTGMRQIVLDMATAAAEQPLRMRAQGPVPIARGSLLEVRVSIPGLEVKPPRSTVVWSGNIGNAGFSFAVPEGTSPGLKPGRATIRSGGFRLALLQFSIAVGSGSREIGIIEPAQYRPRTAFASYASENRAEVMARVQGLEKAGVDVFVDVIKLRSGQHYESIIFDVIPRRDVFYLFWSEAASCSLWVEKEWRCALVTRGLDYIDPIPLVSPELVPPPPELASELHFNDWILAFVKGA